MPLSNPRQEPWWRKYAGRWGLVKLLFTTAAADRWKKKYGGLGVTELRKLRQLEEENSQLKKLVADLSLDKQMLQDVLKKSFKARPIEGPGQKLNQRLWYPHQKSLCSNLATSVTLVLYIQGKGFFGNKKADA